MIFNKKLFEDIIEQKQNLYLLRVQESHLQAQLSMRILDYLAHIYLPQTYSAHIQDHHAHLKQHPDMLYLDPKTLTPAECIESVNHFFLHQPIDWSLKYCIIEDPFAFRAMHWDKLLKNFEEPKVELKVFILCCPGISIPQTIVSRAIELFIDHDPPDQDIESDDEKDKFINELLSKIHSPQELYDEIKRTPHIQAHLINFILDRDLHIPQKNLKSEHFKDLEVMIRLHQKDLNSHALSHELSALIYDFLLDAKQT